MPRFPTGETSGGVRAPPTVGKIPPSPGRQAGGVAALADSGIPFSFPCVAFFLARLLSLPLERSFFLFFLHSLSFFMTFRYSAGSSRGLEGAASFAGCR